MKKFMLCLAAIAILFAGADDLLAGSIDAVSNMSAGNVRNLARNAVNDSADAVVYNPAGTAMMKDGLFLQLNNQTALKTFSQDIEGGDSLESTEPTLVLPSFFAVYKTGSLGIMAGAYVPAGGGKVVYEEGTVDTAAAAQMATGMGLDTEAEVEGSSMYLAGLLGASYAINEMFALSLGARFISAKKTGTSEVIISGTLPPAMGGMAVNEKIKVDYEDEASGFGAIIGIDIVPIPEMNIGLRYEMQTNLEFERTVNEDGSNALIAAATGGLAGGPQVFEGKSDRNLPALLSLGIDYDINPELQAGIGMQYYFITAADEGDDDLYNDEYGNGYEINLGVQYMVMPELAASLSYQYSVMGSNEDTIGPTEIVLDANTVGLGAQYTAMEGLDITLGFAYVIYKSQEDAAGAVEYGRESILIAIGVDYKAM